MQYTVEEAIEILRAEFQDEPHTIDEMLGNAACERKIKQFLSACRYENRAEKDCRETLLGILNEYGASMNNKSEVSILISKYYKD